MGPGLEGFMRFAVVRLWKEAVSSKWMNVGRIQDERVERLRRRLLLLRTETLIAWLLLERVFVIFTALMLMLVFENPTSLASFAQHKVVIAGS